MTNESPYKAPKSNVGKEAESGTYADADPSGGRVEYVLRLFLIFIVLPYSITLVGRVVGYEVPNILRIQAAGGVMKMSANFSSWVWLVLIPLFALATLKRLKHMGLSSLLTPLFMLPIINLLLWVWPGRRR